MASGVLGGRVMLSVSQDYHLSGYPDLVLSGKLCKNRVQVCKFHPGASSQSAPPYLPAAVGKYPEDTVTWRMDGLVVFRTRLQVLGFYPLDAPALDQWSCLIGILRTPTLHDIFSLFCILCFPSRTHTSIRYGPESS